MPSPSANPTPITPPRVPLIDERTGLIDRAWYMFFLSLFNAAQNAVDPDLAGQGIGSLLLTALMDRAREVGVKKVFCLTFAVPFFERHGFTEIADTPVEHDVYEALLQSYDEGVAEFLGLERVKPNTLGNHRMLAFL